MRHLFARLTQASRTARRVPARGITYSEWLLVVFLCVIVAIPAILLISGGVQDRYSDAATEVNGAGTGWGPFPDTVDTATFDTDALSDRGVPFQVTWDDGSTIVGWTSGGHMHTSGAAVDSGRWAVPANHGVDVTVFGVDVSGGAGFAVCRFDAATGGNEDCTSTSAFSPTGNNVLVSSPSGPAGYDWIGIRFSGESHYDDVIVTNVGP